MMAVQKNLETSEYCGAVREAATHNILYHSGVLGLSPGSPASDPASCLEVVDDGLDGLK